MGLLKKFGINGMIIITRAATGKTTFLNKVKFSKKYKSISSEIEVMDNFNYGYTRNYIMDENKFILGADNCLSEETKKIMKRKNILAFYDLESAEYFFNLLICNTTKDKKHFNDMLFFYSISSLLITFDNDFTLKKIYNVAKKVYGSDSEISVLNFMKDKKYFLDGYISNIEYCSLPKEMIYYEIMDYFNSILEKESLNKKITVNAGNKEYIRL